MAEINEVEDSKEDIKSKPDKKEEKKRKWIFKFRYTRK